MYGSTPSPVTVYSGAKVTTVTITKPGLVFTIPAVGFSTVRSTVTLIATYVISTNMAVFSLNKHRVTSTVYVPPSGAACVKTK